MSYPASLLRRFKLPLSYHYLGGGDSNPGYDVILMKKGMLDIQQKPRIIWHSYRYSHPEDLDKIYHYKSVIEHHRGIMNYAKRLSNYVWNWLPSVL